MSSSTHSPATSSSSSSMDERKSICLKNNRNIIQTFVFFYCIFGVSFLHLYRIYLLLFSLNEKKTKLINFKRIL